MLNLKKKRKLCGFCHVTAQKLNGKTTCRGRNFPTLHSVQQNNPVCSVNHTGCFEIVIFSGDILGFQSSFSKTKAHFCSQRHRGRETARESERDPGSPCTIKSNNFPLYRSLSCSLPPVLCPLVPLGGGGPTPPQPTSQLM